jgi:hypothetical protein
MMENWVNPLTSMGPGVTPMGGPTLAAAAPVSVDATSLVGSSPVALTIPDLTSGGMGTAAGGSGGGLFGLSGIDTIRGVLGGLQTLGSLWAAWQSAKLAKEQFKFTKDITNTNLANQIKSYNTALTDRITSRAHMQGMSQAEANAYLKSHSLTRNPSGTGG